MFQHSNPVRFPACSVMNTITRTELKCQHVCMQTNKTSVLQHTPKVLLQSEVQILHEPELKPPSQTEKEINLHANTFNLKVLKLILQNQEQQISSKSFLKNNLQLRQKWTSRSVSSAYVTLDPLSPLAVKWRRGGSAVPTSLVAGGSPICVGTLQFLCGLRLHLNDTTVTTKCWQHKHMLHPASLHRAVAIFELKVSEVGWRRG